MSTWIVKSTFDAIRLPRQTYCHGCNTRKELLSYTVNEIGFMISRCAEFASALKNDSREFDNFTFFIHIYKKGRNGNKTLRKELNFTAFYNLMARSNLPYIAIDVWSNEFISDEVHSRINKKLGISDETMSTKFTPSYIVCPHYDWSEDEKRFLLSTISNTWHVPIDSIIPANIDEYISNTRTTEINLSSDEDLIRKDASNE